MTCDENAKSDIHVRSRRVKCDETRPQCLRCLKGQRFCEGYPVARSEKDLAFVHYVSDPVGAQRGLSATPDLDRREARSLDFFRSRVVEELSGSFCEELWSTHLIIVATHESAVRHALVAVSALYENYMAGLDGEQNGGGAMAAFALRQYSRAIRDLFKMDHQTNGIQAADAMLLISTVLFSFECLRDDFQAAMTHLRGGAKLLVEYEGRGCGPDGFYLPRRYFNQLFVRMETQALEWNESFWADEQSLPQGSRCLRQLPSRFGCPYLATLSMNQFLNHLLRFLRSPDGLLRMHPSAEEREQDAARRAGFVRYFESWCSALDRLLDSEPETMATTDTILLQLYRRLILVLLYADTKEDNNLDDFNSEFGAIVSLAGEFLHLVSTVIPEKESLGTQRQTFGSARSNAQKVASQILRSLPASDSFLLHYLPPSKVLGIQPEATPMCTSPELLCRERANKTSIEDEHAPQIWLAPGAAIRPSYTTGLGVVMPLFVVLAWCARRDICDQAQLILSICNRKEGVWDSRAAAEMAASRSIMSKSQVL